MGKNTILSKDFILVVIGQIISIFGNQILRYALPLYLLNQTGSAVLFGIILAVSFIPMILLFPIGGIIADRVNKRNIMVVLDFGTAILIFLFYLLAGRIDIVPLMAITMILLYGIQGAYQPAVKASVPVLVESGHIMKANSVVDMVNSMSSMAGPVIGGLLFSILGLTPVLYVSIGCFFAAAVMEIFICIPFEKRKTTGNIFVTGLGDLKESFSFMFGGRPVIWKISLIFASSNLLLTSLITIALPVIITRHLGFAPDTANRLYGYAQGVIAAGAILGGLLAGVLSNRLRSKTSPVLLIGCSLSILLEGIALQTLSAPMGIYIILIVGGGLLLTLHTLFQIQMMTYLQLLTPNDLIGKVISCFMCVVMCTIPLGQLVYGFVFEHIGSDTYLPFYIAALIMTGISVFTRRIFYGIDHETEKTRKQVTNGA
ncbi:ABC transporter [Desulfocucumis palustris]|uniref:ABC transporter n=1 Tax=Desulfocucumis palustris TaxID=1898651 RepID=A0A2L2XMP1_9FIRM|nr:MFS transporter [Desulfocucumis palustris]GBF35606.1 ABC transporter [Desulfocucumis palustris]